MEERGRGLKNKRNIQMGEWTDELTDEMKMVR